MLIHWTTSLLVVVVCWEHFVGTFVTDRGQEIINDASAVFKAQEILRRYGYLRCGGPVPRRKKLSTLEGLPPLPAKVYGPCPEENFRRALRQYQHTYNMPQTGLLDQRTLLMMAQSRCGNPDDENQTPRPMFKTKRGKKIRRKLSNGNNGNNRGGRNNRPKRQVQEVEVSGWTGMAPSMPEFPTEGAHIRRKRWLEERMEQIGNGQYDQRLEVLHSKVMASRNGRMKRSTNGDVASTGFASDVVTWRMVGSAPSSQLTWKAQRAAFGLSFRMWGEVIPLLFHEDIKSAVNDVDILIAFGQREHLNCPNNFDGYGGQVSHAVRTSSSAEIHVDDDEHLTVQGSEQGTNLVKVGVHEVGHALGLHHISLNSSIMYAIYSKVIPNKNFELDPYDRRMVQAIYGICRGRFDTVFDWVRRHPEDGQLVFNTYFFRGDRTWMYENRLNRTRTGDPLPLGIEWKGVPPKMDTFLHVWTHEFDLIYIFKGRHYWLLDSYEGQVMSGYPRNISDDFGPIQGTNFPTIPNHLDAAFFDIRDSNVYFFKDNLVYAYDINRGKEGCCLPGYPKEIAQEFPMADGSRLPGNLDAVYYSYTDRTLYFFKGTYYYHNVAYNPLDRRRNNRVKGPKDVATKWKDICDTEAN